MNYFWVFVVSAFSITIPAIFALFRIKRLGKRYLPILFLFLLGLLNESISYLMIRGYKTNLVNSNLYTYIECLVLIWFFYRIKRQRLSWIYLSVTIITMVWILDNCWWHSINHNNVIFRIFSSVLIIWLSMDKINELLISGTADRFKTTDLLICIAFLVYHAYRILLHIFNLVTIANNESFIITIWLIHSLLNMLANITYTIAILCIPRQKNYMSYC